MSDELERLRDVARAAAALVKAHHEWRAAHPTTYESADDPDGEILRKVQRRAEVYHARMAELAESLARLADVNPGLVSG